MEITREKSAQHLVLRLAGRLDANWCGHVQNSLSAAVRDGEHRIRVDMAQVNYVSSAGLRVLLTTFKQLKGINGSFGISRASEGVRSILELAGLSMLIATDTDGGATAEAGQAHTSARARYEIFARESLFTGLRLQLIGESGRLRQGVDPAQVEARQFGANAFALGVGALGGTFADCAARFGEFLAVAGVAAFQPADGSSRADFVVSQSALVPEGRLLLGIAGEGVFPTLARFEAKPEARTVGLSELAATALELSGRSTAAFVAVTETAALVGASLRQSPAAPAGAPENRFAYPQIRDWLSFTSERAFRDSTSLLVGVVARPDSEYAPLLRPLGKTGLLAHVHAASLPYRPLRKGPIELRATVTELFDSFSLQAVLHLLADLRDFNGAGESEFFRGALWLAPVQP